MISHILSLSFFCSALKMDGEPANEPVKMGLLKPEDFVLLNPEYIKRGQVRDLRFWQLAQGSCMRCTPEDKAKFLKQSDMEPAEQAEIFNAFVSEQVNYMKKVVAENTPIEQLNIIYEMDNKVTYFFDKTFNKQETGGAAAKVIFFNYMVSLFSQQIPGVLATIKNLNVLVNDATFEPPVEALPKEIQENPLYFDFEVSTYMGQVGTPIGNMADTFEYVSTEIESIRSNCHQRIELDAPAVQRNQLNPEAFATNLELNVLAYRMENIAAESEWDLCKAAIATLGELDQDTVRQLVPKVDLSNILQGKIRIAGSGHKAWPSELAKELLGITGKTVTKKQSVMKWGRTFKNILAMKSQEKRLEESPAYYKKRAALEKLIKKLEGQHFDDSFGMKVPRELNTAQLKYAMESYHASLVERLATLESQVIESEAVLSNFLKSQVL